MRSLLVSLTTSLPISGHLRASVCVERGLNGALTQSLFLDLSTVTCLKNALKVLEYQCF